MVANRLKRTPRRRQRIPRRRSNKNMRSQLQRVADNAPVRCSLPRDPPQLTSSLTTFHTLAFDVLIGYTESTTPKTDYFYPKLAESGDIVVYLTNTNYIPTPILITPNVIHLGTCGRFGFNGNDNAEYALLKVRYWGPTNEQQQPEGKLRREVSPLLIVDCPTISGGITVQDRGTQLHRAALGVSYPVQYWYEKGVQVPLSKLLVSSRAYISPSDISSISKTAKVSAGVLYLSVARRAFPHVQ